MTVANLQSWADNLELVRLPDIESDVADLQADQADTAALLTQKSQEYSDTLAAHSVRIDVAQADALTADAAADQALANIYQVDLDARTFTLVEIQKLREEFAASQAALTAALQSQMGTDIATQVAAAAQPTIDAANTAAAQSQASANAASASAANASSVMDDALNIHLPALATQTTELETSIINQINDWNSFLSGYADPTLVDGFDALSADINSISTTLTSQMDGMTANLTANYYTKAEADSAIAAISEQLGSDMVVLEGTPSGYWVELDDAGKYHASSTGASMYGSGDLGYDDLTVVTDQGSVRSASGVTNGDLIVTIPAAFRETYAGQEIRVAVLARKSSPSGIDGFQWGYSTNDAGDSGIQTETLTDQWQWFTFLYTVPAGVLANDDHIGIWAGSASGTGDNFLVAMVAVEETSNNKPLPTVVPVQASLHRLMALDNNTNSAFATMLNQLSVDANGQIAGITNFGSAMADLHGKTQSSYVLSVVSGTEGQEVAELELFSLSDESGTSTSIARLAADNILLPGSVRAAQMTVDGFLNIDAQDAGFRMDKASVADYANDGVYMGRHADELGNSSFGFFIGSSANNVEQFIRMTKEDGLKIKNAEYLIGSSNYTQSTYTSGQAISLAGLTSFSATLVGGGGGGRGGTDYTGSGGGDGQDGVGTVLQLFDGATLIQTWSALGGAGGSGTSATFKASVVTSQTPYGNSGSGGARGQRKYSTWHEQDGSYTNKWTYGKYGNAGSTGQVVSVNDYDISALTNPNIVISIGSGGNGGIGAGSNASGGSYGSDKWQNYKGGDGLAGSAGVAIVQTTSDVFVPAAPVAVEPTAVGTFMSGVGSPDTAFPNISPGRGFWQITASGADISIKPEGSHWVKIANSGSSTVSFYSHDIPVIKTSSANVTVYYTFRAM